MQKGFILWFTGLSGSGKSTLAQLVEHELRDRGLDVECLDGDEVRQNLSKGLGFSKEDRDTNIRRIGFVANLLARNHAVAITAAISPYKAIRDEIRAKANAPMVEVYCECDLDELERRDVKGLYKKARAGIIKNFTGVDDPYEAPEHPEVKVNTRDEDEEQSAEKILTYLELHGHVPPPPEAASIPFEQRQESLMRLKEHGYI